MSLERLLRQGIQIMSEDVWIIEPGLAQKMMQSLKECVETWEVSG